MTSFGLTRRQQHCLDAIKNYIAEYKSAPSYSDLASMLGLGCKSGINRLLVALKERGHIDFAPHISRSIRVIPGSVPGFVLSPAAADALQRYCVKHQEDDPSAALNDIVLLFVDESEGAVAA